MKIDFVYVINLATDSDLIHKNIQGLNFKDDLRYYEFPAVNGWELVNGKTDSNYVFKQADWWKLPSNPKEPQNDWWSRDLTPGEIGCALSHYQVIEGAYNSGYNNVLILEEDFYLNKEFDKFPEFELNHLDDDWSICYLGRSPLEKDKEKAVNDSVVRCGYTYNTHAYMISRKGMKEILNSGYLDNLIPYDEFFSAIHCAHPRKDAVKNLGNKKFRAYSFKVDYINQSSHYDTDSLTEFTPEYVKALKAKRKLTVSEQLQEDLEPIPVVDKMYPAVEQAIVDYDDDVIERGYPVISEATPKYEPIDCELLNDSNWNNWSEKYINKQLVDQKYDLIIDEPATHIYLFPLFTRRFCKELIQLAEHHEWTTDRHEFYPTTDNLLETLGLKDIYNKVINEYVRPLAIDRFELEGHSWDYLTDESFVIRYKAEEQPHLDIHHDHSNITTLVNLNPGEFKGGGTWFPKYKYLANPTEMGLCTLHPGNITHKHGARPVTEGTRYVVVSFIKNKDHK
jgi:GR25 family glycosyltransferase involved in LPS biosynthesis